MHMRRDVGLDLDGFVSRRASLGPASPAAARSSFWRGGRKAWPGPAVPARMFGLAGSPGAAEILHGEAAKLDVEDEMRGWLVVTVGDGLGHRADPDEGSAVGNDRVRSGTVVGHLPPRPHAHLRRVAGIGDRAPDPSAVTADGHACHRAAEGGFFSRLPVVVTPPAAHGAVSELDGVIGKRVLLDGDTENAGAKQHISLAVNLRCDRAAMTSRRAPSPSRPAPTHHPA